MFPREINAFVDVIVSRLVNYNLYIIKNNRLLAYWVYKVQTFISKYS